MVREEVGRQWVPCGVSQPEMQIPREVQEPQQEKTQEPQQKKTQHPEVEDLREPSTVVTFDTLVEIVALYSRE